MEVRTPPQGSEGPLKSYLLHLTREFVRPASVVPDGVDGSGHIEIPGEGECFTWERHPCLVYYKHPKQTHGVTYHCRVPQEQQAHPRCPRAIW